MKISILTATYNRAHTLPELYNSLLQNSNSGVHLEWLIMNDGSADNTREIVQNFPQTDSLEIKYFHQQNQGKMTAINNLIPHVAGELIIECDSDDYLTENAIKTINSKYKELNNTNKLYALVFLKQNENLQTIGTNFKQNNYKSTMFDLYYKDGLTRRQSLSLY
ncbi:MAG: glycosyltransferase family 2 protein [Oscillospiraceae bacterium]|nr:glycosyltransferase family 2 protein [Oscillospiraceae bacterium]